MLLRALFASACLTLALPASADTALFTADGYRATLYRSPTPSGAAGWTLDTAQLQALLQQQPRRC